MNPTKIIEKYYKKDSLAYNKLIGHDEAVRDNALRIARNMPQLKPDLKFLAEAALLHDIGIIFIHAPQIGCTGDKPYIAHGYLGRELLEKEGLPKHALVCERHVGMGISRDEIIRNKLPLPKRDMLPISTEEEIICLADKFFSKKSDNLASKESINEMRHELRRFGADKVTRFDALLKKYSVS